MKQFKAGKYYVGDLCYVVKEEGEWDKLLEDTNYFENDNQTYNGCPIFAKSTVFGDGEYFDQDDRSYLVDAGIIGIMPFEIIEGKVNRGHIIEFNTDFEVSAKDGVFTFGNIVIDTNEDVVWVYEEFESLKDIGEIDLYEKLNSRLDEMIFEVFDYLTNNDLLEADDFSRSMASKSAIEFQFLLYNEIAQFSINQIFDEYKDGALAIRLDYWSYMILESGIDMARDYINEGHNGWDYYDDEMEAS